MNITKVNVAGQEYFIKDTISGYTSFEYVPATTTGVEVGTMTFNGITYTLYAPEAQQTETLDIYTDTNDTNLVFEKSGSN